MCRQFENIKVYTIQIKILTVVVVILISLAGWKNILNRANALRKFRVDWRYFKLGRPNLRYSALNVAIVGVASPHQL